MRLFPAQAGARRRLGRGDIQPTPVVGSLGPNPGIGTQAALVVMIAALAPALSEEKGKSGPAGGPQRVSLTDEEREILKHRDLLENLELLRNFEEVRYLDFLATPRPKAKDKQAGRRPGNEDENKKKPQ